VIANRNTKQNWLSRLMAAAVLFSIIFMSLLTASHLDDLDSHALGSAYELTAQDSGGSGVDNDDASMDLAVCAAGYLCHVQLALIGDTLAAEPAHLLPGSARPDSGLSLDGRTTDVAIPPPLRMSA